MRGVRGVDERRDRQQLLDSCDRSRRRGLSHDRGNRQRSAASRCTGSVPRMRRRAMRHLHARHGDRRCGVDRAASSSRRRGNPRRACGKSLPVHWLSENIRGGCAGLRIDRKKPAGKPVRAYIPGYDLRVPGSLTEALGLLAGEPGIWQPFAGGTDLMVLLEAGKLSHKRFLSLSKLADLRGIEVTTDAVILGAMTTYTEIQQHRVLQTEFPLLCAAARETGSIATQNRGTLGGNIVNASPAADSPPALLVYDAALELVPARGARGLPYQGFHTGYKTMQLAPDELLRAVRLPRRVKKWRQYYRKVGTRKAQAISKVCFAGAALVENGAIRDVRIALGSVAPIVLRAVKTEDELRGRSVTPTVIAEAFETLGQEIAPIDDIRSTARYRLRVAQNLLEEF